jgi:mRNA interferase RelE/StbE
MYRIVYTKEATKTLRKLPRNVSKLIREKLDDIAANPYVQHNNVTRLQNRSGYRLRVGDWRVIYEVEDAQLVILVLKLGSRGGIYVNERASDREEWTA